MKLWAKVERKSSKESEGESRGDIDHSDSESPSYRCLLTFQSHDKGLICAQFSPTSQLLLTVGSDAVRRTQLLLWNVEALLGTRSLPKSQENLKRCVVARQVSDFHIHRAYFSPFEDLKIVTCGRENVRFWRVKRKHLPACSAVLQRHARGALCTAIGFSTVASHSSAQGSSNSRFDAQSHSSSSMSSNRNEKKMAGRLVLCATSLGTILQIDHDLRRLVGVLRLHSGGINCLIVRDGIAVSGGSDGFLRVWPEDFSDYLLEAKHTEPVTLCSATPQGQRLLVQTGGTVGVLDVVSQEYATLLRSHSGEVKCLCLSGSGDLIASGAMDRTIRVWSVSTGSQLYEFTCKDDAPEALKFHPHSGGEVLCGAFDSGALRAFHVRSTKMILDVLPHSSTPVSLFFASDGQMVCVYSDGAIAKVDVQASDAGELSFRPSSIARPPRAPT